MKAADGSRDFDFWMGSWRIHNKRLRERLKKSTCARKAWRRGKDDVAIT